MASEQDMGEPSSLRTELSDDGQMFAAEFRDGQMQIVEVSPYDKVEESQPGSEFPHGAILPDLPCSDEPAKYLQLHDFSEKGLMQLNLLNFALVKAADGSSSYQLVSSGDGGEQAIACMLSDGDEDDPRESFVVLEDSEGGDVDPCIYLQATTSQEAPSPTPHVEAPPPQRPAPTQKTTQKQQVAPPVQEDTVKRKLTPVEILEKAKAIQRAKGQLSSAGAPKRRGRRVKGSLPPPLELLTSPGFKLYLYSCKQCSFKCNAVKEMSAHKKAEHTVSSLQCARCPYRTTTHSQLLKHERDTHTDHSATFVMTNEEFQTIDLNDPSVMSCDVLVCGACGFESSARTEFLTHIAEQHADLTAA